MGTRTVLTFKDKHDSFNVYQHYDGYPDNILPSIKEAKEFAWDLPRFEASDFAAAYIASNKNKGGGNIYLTTSHKGHMDLDYRYEIEGNDEKLFVKIYQFEEYKDVGPIYKLVEEMNI